MDSEVLEIRTGVERGVIDITVEVSRFVSTQGDGIVQIFCPHATAGIALIETGAGSDVDLLAVIDRVLPPNFDYQHRHGSPGHGADHVLPAFIAPSISIPVLNGEMALGMWQSVVLVDPNRDNPLRRIRLSFLAG